MTRLEVLEVDKARPRRCHSLLNRLEIVENAKFQQVCPRHYAQL